MLRQSDTVVIDVRNAYESAIGHFQPPSTGATLIDPKMRNYSAREKALPKSINQLYQKILDGHYTKTI